MPSKRRKTAAIAAKRILWVLSRAFHLSIAVFQALSSRSLILTPLLPQDRQIGHATTLYAFLRFAWRKPYAFYANSKAPEMPMPELACSQSHAAGSHAWRKPAQ
jgi:hypothetical protein